MEEPMARRTTTANFRRILGFKPRELSRKETARVRNAKESATPAVIPSGRRLEWDWVTSARTMGNSGQIQGAKIVKRPEMKATP